VLSPGENNPSSGCRNVLSTISQRLGCPDFDRGTIRFCCDNFARCAWQGFEHWRRL
jgi:hypothetical protein